MWELRVPGTVCSCQPKSSRLKTVNKACPACLGQRWAAFPPINLLLLKVQPLITGSFLFGLLDILSLKDLSLPLSLFLHLNISREVGRSTSLLGCGLLSTTDLGLHVHLCLVLNNNWSHYKVWEGSMYTAAFISRPEKRSRRRILYIKVCVGDGLWCVISTTPASEGPGGEQQLLLSSRAAVNHITPLGIRVLFTVFKHMLMFSL